jgi:hypothetical protein
VKAFVVGKRYFIAGLWLAALMCMLLFSSLLNARAVVPQAGPPVSLQIAGSYPSGGNNPEFSIFADFNGDGAPDIAVANKASGTLGILLNNGNGTFAAAVTYNTGASPFAITAADLDKDGDLDAVVTLAFSGSSLAIMLNNGAGVFTLANSYSTGGTNPAKVFVLDINNDTNPDLLVPNNSSGTIGVLRGNGNGTFQAATTFGSGGSNPATVVGGDFDADGDTDLAIANDNPANNVAIFLSNGAGAFTFQTTYSAGARPQGLTPRDFNGDGRLDLIVGVGEPSRVMVLLGNGNGTFTVQGTFVPGTDVFNIAVADFNQDGIQDVARIGFPNSTKLSILLGNGDGTFDFAYECELGFSPLRFDAGDANGDGRSDLVISDPTGNRVVVVLTGDLPTISFEDASVVEGNAGTTSMVFTFTLSAACCAEARIDYATSDFEATVADNDYVATSGTLIFPVGVTSRQITVTINGDTKIEGDEAFEFRLNNPVNIELLEENIGRLGTIIDDDTNPIPTLTVVDSSVIEGTGLGVTALIFTSTLSAPAATPVTFTYSTANGTATVPADYNAVVGTGVIPAGAISTTVLVNVAQDSLDEPNETLTLNLTGVQGATPATVSAIGTIVDDDGEPALTLAGTTVTEGTGAGTTIAIFTATLSSASSLPITVTYTTADGTATALTDYTTTTGLLVIPPGSLSATISVNVVRDALDENGETFRVLLSNPVSVNLANTEATGTIIDDDVTVQVPAVRVGDVAIREGNTGSSTLVFSVTLSSAANTPVSLNFATQNGSATAGVDYQPISGTLTFAPGETEKSVSVTIIGDILVESDETFLLVLSNLTGATFAVDRAFGTIVDDDDVITQARLIAQFRVTPDRVISVDPSNLITFTFRVKNEGDSRAWQNQLELPLDPNFEIAYAVFADKRIWVRKIFSDVIWIPLPDMLKGQDWLEGQVVFRPKAGVKPGTVVKLLRYKVRYEDLAAPLNFKESNAQSFAFSTENLDVARGDQQQLEPDRITVGLGSREKLTLTGKFFMPNEEVEMWLTKPDGTSELLGKNDSNYQGITFYELNVQNLVSGDHIFTMRGKQTGTSGNLILSVKL